MINVSISYVVGDNNCCQLGAVPTSIQLALYKYEIYKEARTQIYQELKDNNINVVAIHLPTDTLKVDYSDSIEMMKDLMTNIGCDRFVLHPNKGVKNFLSETHKHMYPYYNPKICLETFGWKSNKELRTPLEIIEFILKEKQGTGIYSMVMDTSHIEELWFDHRILGHLLKYTSIIHLSNRAKGIGNHMPFNDQRGNLTLVKFVRDLKRRYNWRGDIVLEYMEEYKHKLLKNASYIESLLK